MSVFDEVETLRLKCWESGLEIGRVKDLIVQLSRLIHTIKGQISSTEAGLELMDGSLKFMKSSAPVVLLSEYEHVAFRRIETLDLLAVKRQEIQNLERQIVTARDSLPILEAEHARLTVQCSKFGKVLEFSR